MNNQTSETVESTTWSNEQRDRLLDHMVGIINELRGRGVDEAARIFRRTLEEACPRVLSKLEDDIFERRHFVTADIGWLQEIERSAMDLLRCAPDYDDDMNGNEIAVAATRIFSRVRFILPKDHEARHHEPDDDEVDDESPADEPSRVHARVEIDATDNDAQASVEGS